MSRSKKEVIVWTNGCFDLLHEGHEYLLRESKKLGTKLIVGLNRDGAVRELKGLNRPIEPYTVREQKLLDTGFVDIVIPIDKTPIDGILKHKPDIVTKGDDYKEEEVIGYGVATVQIIRRLPGKSTTGRIQTRKTR